MIRNKSGSVTVYFSFITLLLLAFIGALLEGSRVAALQLRLPQALEATGDSLLACYDRDLQGEYGLMFLREDVSGTADLMMEGFLAPEMDANAGRLITYPQLLSFKTYRGDIDRVYRANANKGALFLREIVELMKYQETATMVKTIYNMVKSEKNSRDMMAMADDEAQNYSDTDWQAMADQLEADANGVELDSETFNPVMGGTINQDVKEDVDESLIGQMERLIGDAELSLLLPGKDISSRSEKLLPVWVCQEEIEGVDNPDMDFVEAVLFLEYVSSHFGNYLGPSGAGSLEYEQEYIINGYTTDSLNLTMTVNRLMVLRAGMNVATILSHADMYGQATALATVLVGWTGLAPLVESVKFMIVASWGAGEAVLDVRALADGERVPFYKNETTMSSSLAECFTRVASGQKAVTTANGLDYQTYLKLFIFLEGNTVIERTMKMIEMNMRVKDPLFSFDRLIYGFELSVNATSVPIFSPAYRYWVKSSVMNYDYNASFTY